LADKAGVAVKSVQLSVLGVHAISRSSHGRRQPSTAFRSTRCSRPTALDTTNWQQSVSREQRAESIFYAKGATLFGIGSVVANICASVRFDRRDVQPISHFQPEFGCCFSLPVVLGSKGIMKTIKMPLETDENAAIARSAKRLKRQ